MKKYLLTLLFTLVALCCANAQEYNPEKRDSLIKLLEKYNQQKKELRQFNIMPADTQKAILLWDINNCDDYYKNPKEFDARLNELKDISYKLNYKKGIANALTGEALLLSIKLENKKALELNKQALEIRQAIGDQWGVRWSYFNIGACYQWQNLNKDAMPWYMKGLKLGEVAKDSTLLYLIYSGLSGIYDGLGDIKEAMLYSEKSAVFANTSNGKYNYALALMFLGEYYSKLKKFDKADSVFTIAYSKSMELKSFYHLGYYYNTKSDLESNRGNYGNAILSLIQSNAMEDSTGVTQNKPYSLRTIANYILKADEHQLAIAGIPESKKFEEVIRYAQQSLAITIPSGIMDMTADNYKFMSTAYEAKGNMEQAYKYFKMGTEIKDSLYNAENTKTIQGLKMQYETEKKEQQITLLNKDKLIQQQEISKQTTQRNSVIGGFALVLLIGGVTVNRYRVKQRTNRQLSVSLERLKNAQQQLVEQEKLASLGALTAGIAHEIKNPLNFINNFSVLNDEIVEDLAEAKDDAEREKLVGFLKMNYEKINEHSIRADSIVKNMLSHRSEEKNEKEPVNFNELCEEYFKIAYKAMRVTYPDFICELITDLDPAITNVQLIAQDFSRVLLNISGNAFYSVNERSLESDTDYKPKVHLITSSLPISTGHLIAVTIRDNGKGIPEKMKEKIFEPFFTTKPAGQGTGLGLSLSFDIIKAHGGDVKVVSKENEFTEFIITLPV